MLLSLISDTNLNKEGFFKKVNDILTNVTFA